MTLFMLPLPRYLCVFNSSTHIFTDPALGPFLSVKMSVGYVRSPQQRVPLLHSNLVKAGPATWTSTRMQQSAS